jgi:hypothetical protein
MTIVMVLRKPAEAQIFLELRFSVAKDWETGF